jgi:hypothetical protein
VEVQAVQADLRACQPNDDGSKMGDYCSFALSLHTILIFYLCISKSVNK